MRQAMRLATGLGLAALLLGAGTAGADVFNLGGVRNPDGTWTGLASLETVPVGNPGNAGELSGDSAPGDGPDRICGAVAYEYRIGKYEVTAGQYAEFLNAVAVTDVYGLYKARMDVDSGLSQAEWGCNIKRSGSSGSYVYSVAGDWANRPVNYVSWTDAARFANWLHNGQPTGAQNATTTEDGAYDLTGTHQYYGPNGEIPNYGTPEWEGLLNALQAVTREADWTWAITSEDEWYKAAYYDPATGSYYDYPTRSNVRPRNDLVDPDPGNNATFREDFDDLTIGAPYFRTEVGAHENSSSPYGTFDQGGNVMEWNESILYDQSRGLQGAEWLDWGAGMQACDRLDAARPMSWGSGFGFRVSAVEPWSSPVEPGPSQAAEVGGGSGVVGGVDLLFDAVATGGTVRGEYAPTPIADLSPEDLAAMGFLLPTDPLQLWSLEFDGDFSGDVQLTFCYDDNLLVPGISEDMLYVYHQTAGGWEQLPVVSRDLVGNTITVTTTSFSDFALGAVPEPSSAALLALGAAALLKRRRVRGG